jgi:hypothetical protein
MMIFDGVFDAVFGRGIDAEVGIRRKGRRLRV